MRAAVSGVLGTTFTAHAVPDGSIRSASWVDTMQLDKDASIAVVVKREWANLHGVRMFLRPHENPQPEIRGVDESHILFATILDSEDARGIWIELTADRREPDSAVERFSLLVPWSQVLTIVVAKQFSSAIRQEARKIGFTGETERE
jgi:hypothetical protein